MYVNSVQHNNDFIMMKTNEFPLDSIIDPDSPYLFTLKSNGVITNHFVCQYGDTTNLRYYLKKIKHISL